MLPLRVVCVDRPVVIYLECQLLGNLFLVLPFLVGQITALLNWIPLREKKEADEPIGASVRVGSAEGFSLHFRTEAQPGFGTGQLKYYPSDWARTLLEDYFSGNPPNHFDPHQTITG